MFSDCTARGVQRNSKAGANIKKYTFCEILNLMSQRRGPRTVAPPPSVHLCVQPIANINQMLAREGGQNTNIFQETHILQRPPCFIIVYNVHLLCCSGKVNTHNIDLFFRQIVYVYFYQDCPCYLALV